MRESGDLDAFVFATTTEYLTRTKTESLVCWLETDIYGHFLVRR